MEHLKKISEFIIRTIIVLVDETKTMDEQSRGKFDWVDALPFPLPKAEKGRILEKEVFLFHFPKYMSTEGIITEMDKSGYAPGTIYDLLALAFKEPDLQRKFPIVALGSVFKVYCCGRILNEFATYLFQNDGKRGLGRVLYLKHGCWQSRCCFLAVRK